MFAVCYRSADVLLRGPHSAGKSLFSATKVLVNMGALLTHLQVMIIKQDRDEVFQHGRWGLKVLSIVS